MGEAPFPEWPTVCSSLEQAGSLWNSCNHAASIYGALTASPVHVVHLSPLHPLSVSISVHLTQRTHTQILTQQLLSAAQGPRSPMDWIPLFLSPCCLFLRLRVSMCLSPFLQRCPEDILCAESYTFPSPPKTSISASLWPPLSYSPCLSPLFLFESPYLPSLSLLSQSVSLSLSLPECLYLSFKFPFLF